MTITDPQATAFTIQQLIAEFSYRLDVLDGLSVHELFTEDGTYTIDGKTVSGRSRIQEGYIARLARGPRLSRHLFTNIRFGTLRAASARITASMVLYAANGVRVLESAPPLMVADVEADLVISDTQWRFHTLTLTSVFRGSGELVSPTNSSAASTMKGHQ